MKRNIAKHQLALAKENEAKRLLFVKKAFIDEFIDQHCSHIRNKYAPTYKFNVDEPYMVRTFDYPLIDILIVAKSFGFTYEIPEDHDVIIYAINLSIPEYIEGTKRTLAQQLLINPKAILEEYNKIIFDIAKFDFDVFVNDIANIQHANKSSKISFARFDFSTYQITYKSKLRYDPILSDASDVYQASLKAIAKENGYIDMDFTSSGYWTLYFKDSIEEA